MNNTVAGISLASHHFACDLAQPLCDPIVLLHGWGGNSNLWQPLIPSLQKITSVVAIDLPGFGESSEIDNFSLDAVIALIAEKLPARAVLIGWSLGGMLAVHLAVRFPQKISRIITLAANVKFVVGDGYDTAMPVTVNRQFNENFERAPEETLKLFGGLMAQGDINDRSILRNMRALAADKINSNWSQALQLLAQLDNRAHFAKLNQPGLHLLGEADILVPLSAAQSLVKLNGRQQVKVLAETAHALHWSKPSEVAVYIIEFLTSLDKKRVAQSFSKAAYTYDYVANLQREVGEKLLQQMEVDHSIKTVLDLGCGTGHFTGRLIHFFPQAGIIGLDIAEGMLNFARARNNNEFNWLCADAENLPLAENSVDVIFSSLALQWCNNLDGLFSGLQRVLKPGGRILFSTLGPKTLSELKSAWEQVDDYVHVNRFHEQSAITNSLIGNGFSSVNCEQLPSILEFEKLSDLTRSLKALGAHNINRGRAPGLNGRKKIEAFKNAYESYRHNGLLPATYDVFYVTAEKTRVS